METKTLSNGAQSALPHVLIQGEPLQQLPEDLYIPPDALEIILETFTGPLDLLLYLIKKQNLDILNIPIAKITEQYIQYIEMMQQLRLELAADYLVMAALLAEIKSRMLLPRPNDAEADEEDPRAELIRRLQEYERFKTVAEELDTLPRLERDIFLVTGKQPELDESKPLPQIQLDDLMSALRDVMQRIQLNANHHVQREPLSVRERMTSILEHIKKNEFSSFHDLFKGEEGRRGVVVTFVAILELLRQSLIQIIQTEPYSPIHISVAS